MRNQAIEKLAKKIINSVAANHTLTAEEKNLIVKWGIITDRTNGDRASSVIREVMNNDS